ncbi:hypothetical protein H1C71_032689 [Ictidomys tridecemlineatus]|nr:hypothetical protein H1C71_032689 [Ictidomys tridecemlineatus]
MGIRLKGGFVLQDLELGCCNMEAASHEAPTPIREDGMQEKRQRIMKQVPAGAAQAPGSILRTRTGRPDALGRSEPALQGKIKKPGQGCRPAQCPPPTWHMWPLLVPGTEEDALLKNP